MAKITGGVRRTKEHVVPGLMIRVRLEAALDKVRRKRDKKSDTLKLMLSDSNKRGRPMFVSVRRAAEAEINELNEELEDVLEKILELDDNPERAQEIADDTGI